MHVCRLHAVVHPIVIFISKSHINCIYFIFCSKCLNRFITNKCRIIDEINCPCKLKGKKNQIIMRLKVQQNSQFQFTPILISSNSPTQIKNFFITLTFPSKHLTRSKNDLSPFSVPHIFVQVLTLHMIFSYCCLGSGYSFPY